MRSRIFIGLLIAGMCATAGAAQDPSPQPATPTHLTMRNAALSIADEGDTVQADRPDEISTVNYVYGNGFDLPRPYAADLRFSIMWVSSDGTAHRAAIRGDGSIRDTDDPGLTLAHVGVGHFCIIPTDVEEGAVGVTQGYGNPPSTIDVTMGIGNPCPQEPDAPISVQTWMTP